MPDNIRNTETTTIGVAFEPTEDPTEQQLPPLNIDWNYVLSELESPDDEQLSSHLKERVNPLIRIQSIVDDKGFSLLHHAVLKGIPGKVQVLIDLFNKGIHE